MWSNSIRIKWDTSRECPRRFAQSEVAGLWTTSYCVGCVPPRIESRQSNVELSEIEDDGETTYYQTIRTRNFKVRNERFETGTLIQSHEERNVSVERKIGEYFRRTTSRKCSKGDSCIFSNDPVLIKEQNHPVLHWNRRSRLTEGSLIEIAVQERVMSSSRVINYKSESECKYDDCCHIRHTQWS